MSQDRAHCVKAVSGPQHMEGESSGLTKLRTQTGVWQDKLQFGGQSTWGPELYAEPWSPGVLWHLHESFE